MTPAEFKEARKALGLSAAKMAAALALGENGGRTIRRWESGDRRISDQVAAHVRLLAERQAASR